MNSFDLNIDHRCFYELPAHFIFIFTGFSPFTHVDDPMMTSCLDLSKTQSILFSLLWCSFEVDVSSSDLTIDSASCCIFSDFFGIYVQLDNRCCSLIVIDLLIEWSSWAPWTDLSSWPRLLTSHMCLFTPITWWPQYICENDEIIQHTHFQPVPHSVCCHCWYRFI